MSRRSTTGLERRSNRSIFEDPLMTPPTTEWPSSGWDDEGSVRGWTFRDDRPGSILHDFVSDERGEAYGLRYYVFRVTEYIERNQHTQETPDYGESETYYRGYVHAPGVESFPAGNGGVYVTDCEPREGWFAWDERHWQHGYQPGESMRDAAVRKTKTLAKGLSRRVTNGE